MAGEEAGGVVRRAARERPKGLLHPAYVAGIIDGEGSILVRRRSTPYVTVASVTEELIERLADLGGFVQHRGPSTLGTRTIWVWTIIGERAALILRACHPYMLIKAERATAALSAWEVQTLAMVNPRKRRTHIEDARTAMSELGWPVSGPDLSELTCRHGHPMTPANTYTTSEGAVCLPCKEATHARYRERRRAAA